MSQIDSAIRTLALAHDAAPAVNSRYAELSVAITDVVAAHHAAANKIQPDRTAIAAQMLAAVVATDPDRRNTCADMARVAITLTDALLLELAAPVAITAPDRDPR